MGGGRTMTYSGQSENERVRVMTPSVAAGIFLVANFSPKHSSE